MIYVTSDLHGCYDEFMELLETIHFSEQDELYILGDVIDRGLAPMKLLQYIMAQENIHMIMGNHEDMFMKSIIPPYYSPEKRNKLQKDFQFQSNQNLWFYHNGGYTTAIEYNKLSFKEQSQLYYFLNALPYHKVLTVNDVKFLLVHGYPSSEYIKNPKKEDNKEIVLWDRIKHYDIDVDLVPGYKTISGHTPTFSYGIEYANKVIEGENKYIIDGGCVFGYSLTCLCLNDMAYTYIKAKNTN